MHNIETTIVALAMGDDTNTSHVATTGDHGDGAGIKPDEFSDLAGLDINLNRVVDLDGWVWVPDGTGVVGDKIGDTLGAKLHALDLCQLITGLGLGDAVNCEASLGVIDKAEVLAGLFNGDHVHESGGVCGVCADFTVDFDEALHDDRFDLSVVCQY